MGSKSRFQKHIPKGIAYQLAIQNVYNPKKTFQIQSIASYDAGVEFLERNQDLAAAKAFQDAITFDSSFSQAWGNLGVAQMQLGQYHEAETSYRNCLRHNPKDDLFWGNLGRLYVILDHLNDAETALLEAIRINENNINALANLGEVYYFQKKYPQAEKYLRSCLTINDRVVVPRAYYHLGQCAFEQEQFEIALVWFTLALEFKMEYENTKKYIKEIFNRMKSMDAN